MGSHLGPVLTNVFLCLHERKCLRECPVIYAPIFYKCYLDDIFLLLKSENHVNNLLLYLNPKHPSTSFACEIEKERSLAFLDIDISRVNNKFEVSVHHKSAFFGVYTNYRPFIATEYKSSLITTLLHRSFTIVSDYYKLAKEIVTQNRC